MPRLALLILALGACDSTPPALSFVSPDVSTDAQAHLDLRGVSRGEVHAVVDEEAGIHARVLVDGNEVAASDQDCNGECPLALTYDSTALAPGTHTLELDVSDDSDNAAPPQTWTADVDDVVAIMAPTNGRARLVDASGTEIAEAGISTTNSVVFIVDGGRVLGSADLARIAGPVHFATYGVDGSDIVTASHTVSEWRAQTGPVAFADGTEMTFAFGRPYTGPESPLAHVPPPVEGCTGNDDLCNVGAGCNAGGTAGLATVVPLALGLVLVTRRRRRVPA